MKNDAVKVEVNMAAVKKSNMGKTKLKGEDNPSTSDDKFDSMMKTMEKLMDRLALGNSSELPVQHEPLFRNPQFGRPQN